MTSRSPATRIRVRHTVKQITLLSALVSLLLTMATPFVSPADAGHGDPYHPEDGTLDNAGFFNADDVCGSGNDTQIDTTGGKKWQTIHTEDAPVILAGSLGVPKSDICDFWMDSTIDASGDVWLYVGFTRFNNSGSTEFYLELLDSAADCNIFDTAACNPFENRNDGSRVIAFDWQGNDAIIAPTLRVWNGTTFGNHQTLAPNAAGSTGNGGLFGEFAINLSDAGILPNVDESDACEIIASALPMTLPGNSAEANPKDIVLGNTPPIQTCGALQVIKQVTGGNTFGDTFQITVSDSSGAIDSDSLGHDGTLTVVDLPEDDDYAVAEQLPGSGWAIDSISCTDGSSSSAGVTTLTGIAVTAGETTVCTVTNSPDLPTITLEKTVVNDDGGTLNQDDFPSFVDGSLVAWDTTVTTTPGNHTASETEQPGYAASDWGGDCAADGTFTAVLGEDYVCTITNDDVAPTIRLEKTVVNDDGGQLDEGDFPSYLDGSPLAWDTTVDILAGPHAASEDQQDGYTSEGWGGDCTADGNFTAELGNDYVCTIINDDVPAGLTIVKEVINDDGGTLQATDFPLVYTPEGGSPVVVENNVATSVPAGTYTIGEEQQAGYELTGIECDNGVSAGAGENTVQVTVPNGATVVCTITNDDIAPTITLEKTVVNDDGGTLDEDDFPAYVDGNAVAWDDEVTISAGSHTASEDQQPGYTAGDWGGDCAADGTFTAELDTDYVCTITNDDQPATVVLRKTVVNDAGGTLTQDDFPAYVDGNSVDWDDQVAIDAGQHTASEDQQPGYAAGDWGGDCAVDGTFTAELGGTYECTITNDDIAPTITLEKTVVNDDGGELDEGDFPSYVDGNPLAWNTTIDILAGAHTASEDQQPGYTAGDWGGDCAADGTFTAALDTDYVCTITNDDEPGELILTKVVINEAGGTATQDDFVPTIDGADGDWGSNTVDAGTYTIDERDADGSSLLDDGEYVQVSIVCDGQSTDMITVPNGETRECIVTNQDVPAGLTVVKQVSNNWNGTLTPADFPLTINGDTVESGAFANYPAGGYTIAEQQQPGYELVDLDCVSDRFGNLDVEAGESVDISVANNESVVCTFTNRDLPASLTVLKDVVNDDGGTATQDDFTPLVNDDETVWGSQNVTIGDQNGVPAGLYTIGELLADGYALDSIVCTDDTVLGEAASTVTVELGLAESVTCTVTNDDIAPTEVLHKVVVNDDGGTATQDDFTPLFDGDDVVWDETITTVAGAHTAGEVASEGYLPGDWTGDCAADGSLVTEVGGTYECTITNDDLPAGLTVVKEVVNDDGGSLGVEDFPLTVTPEGGDVVTVTSGSESFVAAGTYTISEEQQDGYALTGITCTDGTSLASGADSVEVTVGLDDRVLCTVVNDDLPIGISVVKSADATTVTFDPDEDAPVVTYTYVVTNTGQTTLTNVTLVDDVLGLISLPTTTLVPGQVVIGTATHTVTADDAEAGTIVNIADVTGTSPDGRVAEDDDDETVAVNEAAVAPDVVTPPAPAPAPAPAPRALPRTGADTMQLALWSLLVAGLGVMFLLLSENPAPEGARRRRKR